MRTGYQVTRIERNNEEDPQRHDLDPENNELIIGIFLPKKLCNCYSMTIGHSVLWYGVGDQTYVVSFTPYNDEKSIFRGWYNAFCRVAGRYHDLAGVSEVYADTSYDKIYYRVRYIDDVIGSNRIAWLHGKCVDLKRNALTYKGVSTVCCLGSCSESTWKKHNCTSVIVSLLPGMGLRSHLNYPFQIFVFNLFIGATGAFYIALIKQVHDKGQNASRPERNSQNFAIAALFLNALYVFYSVLHFCFRESCARLRNRFAVWETRPLMRDYYSLRRICVLNVVASLVLVVITEARCSCIKESYFEGQIKTMEYAYLLSMVLLYSLMIKTLPYDFFNGCTNPYTLRNLLDRVAHGPAEIEELLVGEHYAETRTQRDDALLSFD